MSNDKVEVREMSADLRLKIAVDLFRNNLVSLGKAADISGLSLPGFVQHLSDRGIDIVQYDETAQKETRDLSRWLVS